MASIKNLKKDINYILGDLITEVSTKANKKEADLIIDEIIVTFDELIAKVNDKKPENKQAHLKQVNQDLEQEAGKLLAKINEVK
jgi:hypothetical protein